MANIILLFACFAIGILLRATRKLPEDAPATLNGFIINVALPALVLQYIHGMRPDFALLGAALMPWLLFCMGAGTLWAVSRALRFDRGTTGALMMLGGLGNTALIGLPMVQSFYGKPFIAAGLLIDQLGTYLVLSTLGILVACLHSENHISARDIVRRVASFPPLIATVIAIALMPVGFPDWLTVTLHRIGDTLTPLALVSVGFQLRLGALADNKLALAAGLGFKLLMGPALIALIYFAILRDDPAITRVTIFESAMAPQIGASIVAIQHGLNPPLVTLLVGIGTLLSFATVPLWYSVLGGG